MSSTRHLVDRLPGIKPGTPIYGNKGDARCHNHKAALRPPYQPGRTYWINELGNPEEALCASDGTLHRKTQQSTGVAAA